MIDTNVAIEFINDLPKAQGRLQPGAVVFVSAVVLGELFFGARNSKQVSGNLANVEHFASTVKILVVDLSITRWYGDVRAALEKKGRRIPQNDMWIAATALTHGLPLATRDQHFDEVEGLQVLRW